MRHVDSSARRHAVSTLVVSALVIGTAATAVAGTADEASGCERWVDPAGSDAGTGSTSSPWRTLEHASEATPDDTCTVWFRPGAYAGDQDVERRFVTPTTFRSEVPYAARFEGTTTVIDIDGARNVALEGFEIRHAGPGSIGYVVMVDSSTEFPGEDITLRNNIIHDSFDNDLVKVHNGVRRATVEGNLLFNQGPAEQHMDINSVTDVVVQDNVMFNDYAFSGRVPNGDEKHFIIIKDSNEGADGLYGARRIAVRRNVFLNWQASIDNMVKVGNDGKPYHEAVDVDVESNLFVGNSGTMTRAPFGVAGARDVSFVNNTVVGDLPAKRHGFTLEVKDLNPLNENIQFVNNIWSDPTGTMAEFASGTPSQTLGLVIHRNLYWNGGQAFPDADFDPALDAAAVIADPGLPGGHDSIVLPTWGPGGFTSGSGSIRAEFERLALRYGTVTGSSRAVGLADPAWAPTTDLLGRARDAAPDLGAFEAGSGSTDSSTTTTTMATTTTTMPTTTTTMATTTTTTSSTTTTTTTTTTTQPKNPKGKGRTTRR